jgi:hypothetical protein
MYDSNFSSTAIVATRAEQLHARELKVLLYLGPLPT